jgi:hypothetical protein
MSIATGPDRVVKTLRPTQAGAMKLSRRYGPALVCVRYRHDASGNTRYTTVELIVEQAPVQRRITDRTMVGVTIAWGEAALRAKAKSMGARWDEPSRSWRMSMRTARLLDVTDRIQQTWL